MSLYRVSPLSGCHAAYVTSLVKGDNCHQCLYNRIDLWKVRICRGHVTLIMGRIRKITHQPGNKGHGKDQNKYYFFLNFLFMVGGECYEIWKKNHDFRFAIKKKKNYCLISQSCFIRLNDQNKRHDRCPCEIFQRPNTKGKIARVKKIVILNFERFHQKLSYDILTVTELITALILLVYFILVLCQIDIFVNLFGSGKNWLFSHLLFS